MKSCHKCGESDLSKFGKNKNNKDGLQTYCKKCRAEYDKKWKYELNPDSYKKTQLKFKNSEKHKEYQKDYYRKNREQIIERAKKCYYGNQAQRKLQSKRYYSAHKEEMYARSRRAILNNPERSKQYQLNYSLRHKDEIAKRRTERRRLHGRAKDNERRRGTDRSKEKLARRSREHNRIFDFTKEDWNQILFAFDNKCAYCRKEGKMHRDHFIPVSNTFGNTVPGNIVPACISCNSSKINKFPLEWVVDKFGLERYYEIRDIINPFTDTYEHERFIGKRVGSKSKNSNRESL